jgi:hypothetical protein
VEPNAFQTLKAAGIDVSWVSPELMRRPLEDFPRSFRPGDHQTYLSISACRIRSSGSPALARAGSGEEAEVEQGMGMAEAFGTG